MPDISAAGIGPIPDRQPARGIGEQKLPENQAK
jgi:hypothetical protein